MPLNRKSFSFVQRFMKAALKQAHREYSWLDPGVGIVERERAAVRISLLEELCREFDVPLIKTKRCELCTNTFPELGAGRKYCSGACRQKAYRSRLFL